MIMILRLKNAPEDNLKDKDVPIDIKEKLNIEPGFGITNDYCSIAWHFGEKTRIYYKKGTAVEVAHMINEKIKNLI